LAMVKWGDSNAKGSKAGLASCCVIVVAFYIWGGVQKFNGVFENEVFPFLVGPFGHRFTDQFKALWLVGPVGEVLIGLLLFVPRTRVLGLIGVVAMHGLLLYVLGPFGQNCDSMVWPWNIWAVIFGLILFAGNDQWIVAPALNSVAGCFILLLAGVLPILSFFGRWDVFVSMAYYSGRLRDAWITITPNGVKHLPAAYRTGNPGLTADGPGRFRLDITKWSYSATNVPPYAEPRAYVSMVKRLEAMGVPAKEMTLMVRDANGLTNNERTYSAVSFR